MSKYIVDIHGEIEGDYEIIKKYEEPTTKNDLGVDCIDRQTAITFVCKNTEEILKDTIPLEVKLSDDYLYENIAKIMRNPKVLPSVTPQEQKTEKFAKWVASEIFDDNWEYNKDAFAELACRKLEKLGIVRAKGNEWELVEPKESEDNK